MLIMFMDTNYDEQGNPKLLFIERRNLALQYIEARKLFYRELFFESFEILYMCKRRIENKNDLSFPIYALCLTKLGDIYYHFSDFESAKKQYLTWYNLPNKYAEVPQSVINSLTLVYVFQKQLDSAHFFYEKAFNISKKLNDSIWMKIIAGNQSDILAQQNNFKNAEKNFNASIDFFNDDSTYYEIVAMNYLNLASLALEQKKFASLKSYLDSSQFYFAKYHKPPTPIWYNLKSEYFLQSHQLDSAMAYFKESKLLDEFENENKNPILIAKIEQILLEEEQQNEKIIHYNHINKLNSKNNLNTLISLSVIFVL